MAKAKRPKCRSCGKRRYATWDQAVHFILGATRGGAPPLVVYLCRKGGSGYHVSKRHDWEWSE
jgi:hypothetical protein